MMNSLLYSNSKGRIWGLFPVNRAREWIHCNEAYRRGLTGKGVGVSILDTGVFLHPALKLRVYGFRIKKNSSRMMTMGMERMCSG